jgi:lysine-N-methylase
MYQALPPSPLRVLIDASVERMPENAAGTECASESRPEIFAKIGMNAENHCPLLTSDKLCRVQVELGHDPLPHACATYPRLVRSIGGVEEQALSLSCPEAARLVLLNPNLLDTHPFPQADPAPSGSREAAPTHFWPIRAVVLNVVRNRLYPVWQRLFLLGVLCRRLDSIASGEVEQDVPAFLDRFERAVAAGTLRQPMQALPADRKAQMDAVLRLAGLMLHKSIVKPRFVQTVHAFTEGIGNGPGATLESLTARYAQAHDRFYAPFFARHPQIAENFLVNTIVRCQFPFGREGMKAGSQPDMSREFALLTAQFALTRGLLIGVAGFHGKEFSTAHVVHTVQAASKHFEHHPEFLKMAHELLVELRLDGTNGLAILLRVAETDPAEGEARPAFPAISVPAMPDGRSAWAARPAGKAPPGWIDPLPTAPPMRPRGRQPR